MTTALVSAFSPDFRNLYKGLQSHRAASDFRQHVSLALERQISGQLANQYANSLINISTQQQPPLTTTTKSAKQPPTPKHPPLTASNSVANCNAAATLAKPSQHRKLDRSASEPANRQQQQQQQQPLNSSRYKTELCRPFEESGTCKYGDKCQFAHGYGELRTLSRHPKYKTELCRTFHSTGFCPYGPRCHFIHNSEDSKRCLLDTLQTSSLSPSSVDTDISGFSIGSAGELSPNSSSSSGGSCASSLSGYFLDDPRHPHASLEVDLRHMLTPYDDHHPSSDRRVSVPLRHPVTFLDEQRRLSVPQTAPPTMTSRGFFGGDFAPLGHEDYLAPLKANEDYLATLKTNEDYLKTLSGQEEYLPQQIEDYLSSDDDVPSSIDVLMSELELDDSLYGSTKGEDSLYKSLEESVYESRPEEEESGNPVEAEKTESAALDINRNLIRLPIFSRLSLGSSP